MIDTHAHVHDKAFDDDRAAVFARARDAGITQIVNVGCDIADSQRALSVAAEFDVHASAGIHPHEAKDAPADLGSAFAPLLSDPRVIAIGETGLDYYYDHSPRDMQQTVLRAQLRLARERDLPVIFHHRDAYDDFIAILREEFRPGMRGVVHCFTGDAAQARTYVDEFGLLLGIGGVVTFKTAQALRDAVCAVGLPAIVLETDCPYLAPVPHRGARNEPAYVTASAAKVADILATPVERVAEITDRNARDLFRL
ncbi:MAG TPA: TatD family hydrolase [Candidatus Baltobacteraceae bacterium]|jgi:TatD DNase family protein|nr:TatD family hydrolase [Candidatus Baltobacteraceae bacterium]